MKRKKTRHKLYAVDFLANISLDGSRSSCVAGRSEIDTGSIFSNGHILSEAHRVDGTGATDSRGASQLTEPHPNDDPSGAGTSVQRGSRSSDAVQSDRRNKSTYESARKSPKLGAGRNVDQQNELESSEYKQPIGTTSQSTFTTPFKYNGIYRAQDSRVLWSNLHATRLAICPLGFPKTVLTVFSVIHRKRSTGRSHRSLANLPVVCMDGDVTTAHALLTQTHAKQSSSIASAKDFGPTLFGSDMVRPLSSFRPTDDEVLSFAAFLHSRPNCWTPTSSTLSATGCRNFGSTIREVDNFLAVNTDSQVLSGGIMTDLSVPTAATGHRQVSAFGSYLPHRRSNLNSPWSRPNRPRNPSGTSSGSASGTNAIVYPDPLIWYSPLLLDDPDLLVATGKQVFQLPNYLTSVLTYTRPSEQKRNVNREFHERFPLIQLTLTKLRSIKAVLVHIIYKLSLDLWIAAHAHVLFEKLILRLFVNKVNRRLCASAALLISAKLNDVKGCDLSALMMELENNFRISRRDIVQAELDVTLGLEFCLIPTESEIWFHCSRIYKNLDLPQPFPLRFCAHTTAPPLPLHPRCTESV